MKFVLALVYLVVEVCESEFLRRIMLVAVIMNLRKIRVDTSQEQRVIKLTH